MKKWMTFAIIVSSIFLCSCGKKEAPGTLEFPGTAWEMSIREVMDALNLEEKDIGYTYVDPYGINSKLYMEGYKLFGAKTKFVDFQFMDFENMMEREISEEWMENQDLLDQAQDGINERFLDLTDHHELIDVLVNYPRDTDMEAVLNEMRNKYGEALSEITMYEFNKSSPMNIPQPVEYKESEQVKFWGSDFVGSCIPKKESEAYRQKWKKYQVAPGIVDGENGITWDIFLETAHMHTILFQRESYQLIFLGQNAGIYRTLQRQISGDP